MKESTDRVSNLCLIHLEYSTMDNENSAIYLPEYEYIKSLSLGQKWPRMSKTKRSIIQSYMLNDLGEALGNSICSMVNRPGILRRLFEKQKE